MYNAYGIICKMFMNEVFFESQRRVEEEEEKKQKELQHELAIQKKK